MQLLHTGISPICNSVVSNAFICSFTYLYLSYIDFDNYYNLNNESINSFEESMKNIYIIGVPRTGKSTLSKLIKAKYPEFNIVSFEAVRNGFIKAFPEQLSLFKKMLYKAGVIKK